MFWPKKIPPFIFALLISLAVGILMSWLGLAWHIAGGMSILSALSTLLVTHP